MNALTSLPRLAVTLDGRELAPGDASCLTEVRVAERLCRPAVCELCYLDPTGELAGTSPGGTLHVALAGTGREMFSGEVVAVDHARGPSGQCEVRLRAFDLLGRLRRRQSVREHLQVTLADLAADLVAGDGITVSGSDPGPLWDRIVQFRHTDLELLEQVASRSGRYFALHGEELRIFSLTGTPPEVDLEPGTSLLEATRTTATVPPCRSVSVSGWDPRTTVSHDDTVAGTDGDGSTWQLADETVQHEDQVRALGEAAVDRRRAAEEILTGVAEGTTGLRPGSRVRLAGSAFVVTEVVHTLDGERGFVSRFTTAPPPARPRPWGSITTHGIVTRVDDPDRLGRVRVSLPTYAGIESDWIPVVVPAAGNGKGLLALPDSGDRVLVLFPREDPAQGVVLGGLYGTTRPPEDVVTDGAVRRYLMRTPGGQLLRLDDGETALQAQDATGNTIELAPDGMLLHAAGDLEIRAPGHTISIRAAAIHFEEA